ncbi:MAG: glycosyltransferase family 4 protein [Chloroflexi bacterium]|nr:glycosyltransferase family 4 protein [Chloroflexota bacterium]
MANQIELKRKRIGVLEYRTGFYTYLRTIMNKLPEAEYVPVRDLFSLRRRLALKVNRMIGKPLIPTFDLNNQFEDFDINKVDLLHLMNGVSYGKTPWVVSFETIVPRLTELVTRHQGANRGEALLTPSVRRALEALGGNACRQLIAWSENSAKIQKDLLREFPAEFSQPILNKLMVLHPPQEVLSKVKPMRAPTAEEPLRFVLVGAAFFRKGGRELFEAFRKLHEEEGLPVRLVVISSLRLEPYAAHESEFDVDWAKDVIDSKPKWLEYYASLPNEQVLSLMKQADVGLLPSWADTYGLSVIEAQACGCPVITTDIRAFPEMNNNRVGWMIKVPKNELGEALYTNETDRQLLSETIRKGLEEIVREIVGNPQLIVDKGTLALEKIKDQHDPRRYADALRSVYGW